MFDLNAQAADSRLKKLKESGHITKFLIRNEEGFLILSIWFSGNKNLIERSFYDSYELFMWVDALEIGLLKGVTFEN